MNALLCLLTLPTLIAPLIAFGQEPGTIPWTPKDGGDLVQNSISVPSKFSALTLSPTLNQVSIPRGWTASVFFAGAALDKGRFMSWGPDSVLFVANMNRGNILALPDADGDGIADTSIVAAQGFSTGHDVRFWRDTMFVSQESGVVKLWRTDLSKYVYDQRQIIIDKAVQPNQIGGNHRTRTLVLDTIRMKLFLSVGSRGNADRESNRGLIEEYEMDGSGGRVYALGTRNAVGMTLHPRTGKLWANNNGSDNQGNNVPPEWVDIVRDGGFYGYPFAYHFRRFYPFTGDYSDLLPITQADTALIQRMAAPAALVDAHCAPMSLVFTENGARPEHQYGAFMAMRGSWNRNPPSGAKIVFLAFDNDQDTIANSVRDFCTGFITDTTNIGSRWARPVGLAVSAGGSVFITSDDTKQFILKVTPPRTTDVLDEDRSSFEMYPNPAGEFVECEMLSSGSTIRVYNGLGKIIDESAVASDRVRFNTSAWPNGTYIFSSGSMSHPQVRSIIISR